MRFKRFILKAAIGILRAVYAPMKLRPAKNKITIISRQSNRPTMDIALLCDYLKKTIRIRNASVCADYWRNPA